MVYISGTCSDIACDYALDLLPLLFEEPEHGDDVARGILQTVLNLFVIENLEIHL